MDTVERMNKLIARFVLQYNFWGYLFSSIKRVPLFEPEKVGFESIMGVGAEPDGTISLYFVPALIEKTDDRNLLTIIEHEGMHILNKHISRLIRILANETKEHMKKAKMGIWNIASDCSANQQANLKEVVINGKLCSLQLPKMYNLPDGKVSEFYYLELLKKQKQNLEKYDKFMEEAKGLIDGHSKWAGNLKGVSDLSSLARKVDNYTTSVIREAAKTFQKERGNLPAYISELIAEALKPPRAPYYQIIRRLVRATRFSKFKRSHTKINRKRAYLFALEEDGLPKLSPFPGRTRDFTFKIVVLIDTSGSMGKDEILEALSGIKNIIENDRHCQTIVLEVDTVVNKEYKPKRIKDIDFKVKGRGGTTLGLGIDRARELNPDVCLAFTDGFTENINAYPRKKFPKKMIWVVTPRGSVEQLNRTGYIVKLD
jgi:predicted metal-dependent peptidase